MIGTSSAMDMTTLTTSSAAAAMAAPVARPPGAAAATAAVRISEPKYQNGITRPRTRPPSALASIDGPAGSRWKIGFTKTAIPNSTPTMMPKTVVVTMASAVNMILSNG